MSPSKGYWDIQNIYMHIYTYSFLSFKYFLNVIALVFFFSQSGLVCMFLESSVSGTQQCIKGSSLLSHEWQRRVTTHILPDWWVEECVLRDLNQSCCSKGHASAVVSMGDEPGAHLLTRIWHHKTNAFWPLQLPWERQILNHGKHSW